MAARPRGRPRGTTRQGVATRQQLYEAAVRLIAARGYEATTLRDIADEAGVSVGLLYRYFPSKSAVASSLYDELSEAYAARASAMSAGPWRQRFMFALRTSLCVLGEQREAIASLTPVLVGDPEEGLFAPASASSRSLVQAVFERAVCGASDAPKGEAAAALGRVLYVVHLAVILWWLIDKSPNQRATDGLLVLLERLLAPFSLVLRFEPARQLVITADALCRDGLFGATPE